MHGGGLVNSKVTRFILQSRLFLPIERGWKGISVTFRENTSLSLNSPPFYSVVKPVLNTGRYTRNIITSLYTPLPTTGGEISQSFGPFVFYETLMNRPYFKINFRATWLEYFAAFHRRAVRLFYNSRISAGSVSLIVRISLILPRKIETFSLSLSFQQRNRTLIPEICILGTSVQDFPSRVSLYFFHLFSILFFPSILFLSS